SQSCLQLFVWWLSFVFVDRAPSDIYTLSLHDALPISVVVGGIVAVPVLAAIALAVRLSSPGPVLYAQWRLGRDGRPFRIWKFRSMVVDADERLARLLAEDPAARREWEATQKLTNDPRVTRVGRFLRATSLDELPQLANVLRGQMSLVGPRPIVD